MTARYPIFGFRRPSPLARSVRRLGSAHGRLPGANSPSRRADFLADFAMGRRVSCFPATDKAVATDIAQCGSKPCTPGEHQNRWYMGLNPPRLWEASVTHGHARCPPHNLGGELRRAALLGIDLTRKLNVVNQCRLEFENNLFTWSGFCDTIVPRQRPTLNPKT